MGVELLLRSQLGETGPDFERAKGRGSISEKTRRIYCSDHNSSRRITRKGGGLEQRWSVDQVPCGPPKMGSKDHSRLCNTPGRYVSIFASENDFGGVGDAGA